MLLYILIIYKESYTYINIILLHILKIIDQKWMAYDTLKVKSQKFCYREESYIWLDINFVSHV